MTAPASAPLATLDVLVADCQATAAAPRGQLIELAWTRTSAARSGDPVHARLIGLPDGERIPTAVVRITGITNDMLSPSSDAVVSASDAWAELAQAASGVAMPTVIHFARFEQPFFERLDPARATPLDIVCTHAIARRLLPDLPRRSLRALVGYLGRAVGPLRRSADHVDATAFAWRELVKLLDAQGLHTWDDLCEWLAAPPPVAAGQMRALVQPTLRGIAFGVKAREPLATRGSAPASISTSAAVAKPTPKSKTSGRRRTPRRTWPMPREVRLALPDAPGVYRMLRISRDVLYVGKATSLHHRVNSYFRKQQHISERTLEMLSQARALSCEVTPTALEAALVEADEIKRHRPPYNVALMTDHREVWFTSTDLSERSLYPTAACPIGPVMSAAMLNAFNALARGERTALTTGRWGPDAETFDTGLERFHAAHAEFAPPIANHRSMHRRLLQLGMRLWREGRRDRDPDDDGEEPVVPVGGATDAVLPAPAFPEMPFALVGESPARRRGRGAAVKPETMLVPTWTPESVQHSLEWLALRAAYERRRAVWLTRLVDAAIVWREPSSSASRLMIIEQGDIIETSTLAPEACGAVAPVPPGHRRAHADRRALFGLATFDRLRVLTTELKRLLAADCPVSVRVSASAALSGERLAAALWWV